jgi:hypothetical protein
MGAFGVKTFSAGSDTTGGRAATDGSAGFGAAFD